MKITKSERRQAPTGFLDKLARLDELGASSRPPPKGRGGDGGCKVEGVKKRRLAEANRL